MSCARAVAEGLPAVKGSKTASVGRLDGVIVPGSERDLVASEELRALGQHVPDLRPELQRRWLPCVKQWQWSVATADVIPDVALAVEMASRYQLSRGSMTIPAG